MQITLNEDDIQKIIEEHLAKNGFNLDLQQVTILTITGRKNASKIVVEIEPKEFMPGTVHLVETPKYTVDIPDEKMETVKQVFRQPSLFESTDSMLKG